MIRNQCAGCQQTIGSTDMVYKLKADLIFHTQCHICCRCGKQLTPGDQILLDEAQKTVSCAVHVFSGEEGKLINCSKRQGCFQSLLHQRATVKFLRFLSSLMKCMRLENSIQKVVGNLWRDEDLELQSNNIRSVGEMRQICAPSWCVAAVRCCVRKNLDNCAQIMTNAGVLII
jgi:hypothetical protein